MTTEEAMEIVCTCEKKPDWKHTSGMIETACRIISTLAPPPNVPLTLEELREMDGEPVWVIPMRESGGFCAWMLVDTTYELCREAHGDMAVFENCGKTWLAYRCPPEGPTHDGPTKEPPEVRHAGFLDLWLSWVHDGSRRDGDGRPVLPAASQEVSIA